MQISYSSFVKNYNINCNKFPMRITTEEKYKGSTFIHTCTFQKSRKPIMHNSDDERVRVRPLCNGE